MTALPVLQPHHRHMRCGYGAPRRRHLQQWQQQNRRPRAAPEPFLGGGGLGGKSSPPGSPSLGPGSPSPSLTQQQQQQQPIRLVTTASAAAAPPVVVTPVVVGGGSSSSVAPSPPPELTILPPADAAPGAAAPPLPNPLAPPQTPLAAVPVASPAPLSLSPSPPQQQPQQRRPPPQPQPQQLHTAANASADADEVKADLAARQEAALVEQSEARARWRLIAGVCASSALLMYATRTCISTAIVPMSAELGWSKQFSGAVLSAFFAGYSVTQVAGGQLSDHYGGSAVLALGVLAWSACAALTPAAAAAGAPYVLAARAGLGAAQGIAFPAIHALLSRGVPPKHRSAAIGAIMGTAHCGSALAFGASPLLCVAGGWPLAFYAFAAGAALWLLPWARMHNDLARAHAASVASAAEGRAAQQQQHEQQHHKHHHHQPQRQQHKDGASASGGSSSSGGASAAAPPGVGFWPLMRRKEVIAIAVAQYASSFGYYGLLAWLPSFFLESCGLCLSKLGAYTLAPYLLQAFVGVFAGAAAQHLIAERRWRVRDVRVLMQVAAMLGPAVALVLAASPLVAGSAGAAVACITAGMSLSALAACGVSASHLDIAPRHAGVVFGVGNTAGTLAGLVAVPAIGWLIGATGSWALAFGAAAAHNVVGAYLWAKWCGGARLPEDGGPTDADMAAALAPAAAVVATTGGAGGDSGSFGGASFGGAKPAAR